MKYIKKDMTSYGLHIIKTDKFKTVTFRVVFRSPIVKEEVTMRNILCNMFLQSNKKYNSKRALTIKAQDLYAADINASNNRIGNKAKYSSCYNDIKGVNRYKLCYYY